MLLLTVSGCGSRQAAAPTASGAHPNATPAAPVAAAQDLLGRPGNEYRVTYKSATRVVSRATLGKSLKSVSSDDTVLVFDAADPDLSGITAGTVLVLERVGLRQVRDAKTEGGQLALLTGPASLTDAIQDGVIRWNIPVRFTAGGPRLAQDGVLDHEFLGQVFGHLVSRAEAAPGSLLSGTKNGWKYELGAMPVPGRLNLAVRLSKSVNNIEAKLEATGYLPDFDTLAAITIADGAVTRMQLENEKLSGAVDMSFTAATTDAPGGFGQKQVRLPTMMRMPFFLGMLPVSLEISSAVTFTPGLGANHQLASARFHLTYTDLKGFDYGGGPAASTNGQSDGSGEILDAKGATMAGIGIVAGISMPRLEMKIGTSSLAAALEKAVPSALADALQQTLFGKLVTQGLAEAEESIKTEGAAHVQVVLVGSFLASGPISLIPCQKTTFTFTANAGADASVLGTKRGEVAVDLFKKDIVKTDPPNINCG
jgi:hypothetical protein